jgi:NitT/TauT family transport system ATP-binding protein
LLRLAAGLIKPSTGEVLCAGKAVSSLNADIAFVTQDSNLSSGLTALANVEFPLAARGISKNERRERAMHWLKLAGVEGFENSYPSQLSGDMQRRVSIVRTLISEPAVVLLDEPFGDFDAQTRMALDQKILELWAEKKNTMLFATHDLAEAITLSDHVVVMTSRPGRIKTIYDVPLARPRNVFEISVEPRFKDAYEDLWRLFRAELD